MIDPRGYSVVEWTDYMNDVLASYGAVPRLDDPKAWKQWALDVLQVPAISYWGAPSPLFYDNWMTWADDFNKALPPQVQ